MHHGLAIVEAWTEQQLDSHKGIISAPLISEEFAETDATRGFVNGFTIHITRLNGAGYQANGSHSGNVAPWGADHHAWVRRHFGHGFCMLLVGDDLPLPENRVTLSETVTDSDGIPAPKITYGLGQNDRRMMDYAIERAKELAGVVEAFDLKVNDFTRPGVGYNPPAWHLLGTCRMGNDPETSVVNPWGQSWEVPNLYLMDGSVLPTGAAVNPTSTIGALALRAASHLRDTFADARRATRTFARLRRNIRCKSSAADQISYDILSGWNISAITGASDENRPPQIRDRARGANSRRISRTPSRGRWNANWKRWKSANGTHWRAIRVPSGF